MKRLSSARIGVMQGRLSPPTGDRIQAFPWANWQEEFSVAERHGFSILEWTLDQERLYENPLLMTIGRSEICALSRRHGITIGSVTGDCFMQAPFWKVTASERASLQRDFCAVVEACSAVGISKVVVPLVDNGRIEGTDQEDVLVAFMRGCSEFLAKCGLRVAFESDFSPGELARFIGRLDPTWFGVNYDIGNSAALGFDPADEFAAYGSRIINVHVKDRVLSGTTVPLGTGNAEFETVFAGLTQVGYTGNYILQTARAADGNHAGVLCRYRDMTVNWLIRHEV